MEPSLIDIVANTATVFPDNLHQMRARHSGLVDGFALANPDILPQVEAQPETIMAPVFLVTDLYCGLVYLPQIVVLEGHLVVFLDLLVDQVLHIILQF